MTHICVGKLLIIGSDNGLSPDRRQAIIWTNAALLSIGPLRTYFSENLIKIQQFSLKKLHVKMSSAKWRPSCLGLNVLKNMVMQDHAPQCNKACFAVWFWSSECWIWYLGSSDSWYRKISNISRTLVGYKIFDHSDVVGALPVGAAPTTSSFST